jgi:ligand-binding sensor domain-containing protein/signal transduction histidine kinase
MITTLDGLAGKAVIAIVEDRQGFLWFGTEKGVSKFDGKQERFTTYTRKDGLPSNIIFKIIEARDGSLWFGTLLGLSRFSSGHFENYTTKNGLISNNIHSLLQDSKGRIWIGTEKGLNCLEKGKFSYYTTADGLAGNMVLSIVEDRYGYTWFGTENGISRFMDGTFFNITTENGLLSNAILSLSEDREGNTWIGTTAGASCLHSLKINNYSVKDGLPNNMVRAVMEDRKGRYWFGTEDGLSCYSNGKFNNYKTPQGLVHNRIHDLMEDRKGKIWIAADGGLSIYAGGKFTNYTTKNGLLSNVVGSVFEDRKGVVWIGTLDGLNRFREGKCVVPPFSGSLMNAHITKMVEDREGNLWLQTPKGLFRLSSSREQLSHFTTKYGLPHLEILSLTRDGKGRIWFGTKQGLHCLENGEIITFTTADGLPDNHCFFILEDDRQNLWIGTLNGIARFDGEIFKIYSLCEGFPVKNWTDSSCLKDSRGHLWFGSIKGVTRFNPALDRENTVPPPVYTTHINVLEKDMPLSEVHELEYNQNYLRFGFVGLCFSAPKSVVYKYRLEGIDKEWQETRERLVSYPYLPSGNYRFQVKAVNNSGIESLEPAEIQFEILPPFWNTWWFKTLLVLLLLSLAAAIISWRIRRVQEKMTDEARTRRLVIAQRMELLGILAAGAVHDLKNLLSVILGYSKMVEKNYLRGHEVQNQSLVPIEKIKKATGTAIQVVKQILAFTRPKNIIASSANLVNVLKEILDILNITRPADVKILWVPPGEEIRYRINPTHFQQVVMNLCLNAVQAMPDGGELKISLSQISGKEIILEVSDTGTGIENNALEKIFDPLYTTKEQGKGTGLGLFVVKQIVEEYGGKITVRSEPGKGTQFLTTFPLRRLVDFEAGEILPLEDY